MKPKDDKKREKDIDSGLIVNSDKQKKITNHDKEDDPKTPEKKEKPGIDPGDPEIKPGEKEKTRKKIPTSHPGNESEAF